LDLWEGLKMKKSKQPVKEKPSQKNSQGKRRQTLDKIPVSNSQQRKKYLSIIKNQLDKGIVKNQLPFFSEKELQEIEEEGTEKKGGLLMKDIEFLINKKWDISTNTIKQYIQKDLLPRANQKIKTKNGAVSLYPSKFIRHLNFVRIFLHFGKEAMDLIKDFAPSSPNDFELIAMQDVEGGLYDPNEFEEGCFWYLGKAYMIYEEGFEVIEEAIGKAFPKNKSKRNQYLGDLKKIKDLHNRLDNAENSFIAKLKGESK